MRYVLSSAHVDFPLLQRIALPITIGSVRYPGIKIHDTRVGLQAAILAVAHR